MKFEVESGGVRYEVEAPDQDAAIRALQKLKQDAPQMKAQVPAEPEMGVVEDVARSAATGLGEGAAGTVGLLGDVQSVADRAGEWIGNQIFGEPTPEEKAAMDAVRQGRAPTTAEISKATGLDEVKHQPQTKAGEYARTAASFVPGAAAFGPAKEGVSGVVQMGKNTLGYGVVPGLASEGAGQATKGTALEPAARIAAPIVAGGGVAALTRPKRPSAPSVEALKTESQKLYNSPAVKRLMVEPQAFDDMVDDVTRKLVDRGFDPDVHRESAAVLRKLMKSKGVGQKLEDIDGLRQLANDLRVGIDKKEARIAGILIDRLDDFVNKLKPSDLLSGDPKAAANAIVKARSLWSRKSKAEIVENLFYRAENAVGANYTNAGMETALRQQFRSLANNPKLMGKFTPQERDAILKVVRGGKLQNVLRFFGKFAPSGLISTTLSGGAGYALGGPVGAAGVMAAGSGAKSAAARIGLKNARVVDEMVRSGQPIARPPVANLPMLGVDYTAITTNR